MSYHVMSDSTANYCRSNQGGSSHVTAASIAPPRCETRSALHKSNTIEIVGERRLESYMVTGDQKATVCVSYSSP